VVRYTPDGHAERDLLLPVLWIQGWRDREQMQLNLSMLENLFEPLQTVARGLQHVFTQNSGSAVQAFEKMAPWQRVCVPMVGGLIAGLVLYPLALKLYDNGIAYVFCDLGTGACCFLAIVIGFNCYRLW